MSDTPWRTMASILTSPEALTLPRSVMPRLAWAGRVTLLAAREKDGKSTLTACGAAAVTRGAHFLGEACAAGPVLWVAVEEHPHDLVRRAQTFKTDPERLVVLGAVEDPVEVLREAVDAVRPVLVVIDTLATWAGRYVEDARQSTDWTPVMVALTELARTADAAIVLNGHSRKSDGAYRDSTAIGAGVDVILEMSASLDDPNLRTVKARGRWTMQGFAVRFTGDGFELQGSAELSLDARVLLRVEQEPGISLKRLRDAVGGRSADVDIALNVLVRRKAVEDHGTPGGAHAYYLAGVVPVTTSGQGSGQPPLSVVTDCGTSAGQASGQGGCPDPKPYDSETGQPPPLTSPTNWPGR